MDTKPPVTKPNMPDIKIPDIKSKIMPGANKPGGPSLLDKFKALPDKTKAMIVAGGALIAFGIYWFFFRNSSSSPSIPGTAQNQTATDPNTIGAQGPAGISGAPGKRGKRGPRGPRGPVHKKHKHGNPPPHHEHHPGGHKTTPTLRQQYNRSVHWYHIDVHKLHESEQHLTHAEKWLQHLKNVDESLRSHGASASRLRQQGIWIGNQEKRVEQRRANVHYRRKIVANQGRWEQYRKLKWEHKNPPRPGNTRHRRGG